MIFSHSNENFPTHSSFIGLTFWIFDLIYRTKKKKNWESKWIGWMLKWFIMGQAFETVNIVFFRLVLFSQEKVGEREMPHKYHARNIFIVLCVCVCVSRLQCVLIHSFRLFGRNEKLFNSHLYATCRDIVIAQCLLVWTIKSNFIKADNTIYRTVFAYFHLFFFAILTENREKMSFVQCDSLVTPYSW